jgi:hypothetical protein
VASPPFHTDDASLAELRRSGRRPIVREAIINGKEKIIGEILVGKYVGGGIKETDEGYKIYDSNLMEELRYFSAFDYCYWLDARLNVIRILAGLGYEILAIADSGQPSGDFDTTLPFNRLAIELGEGRTSMIGNLCFPSSLWAFPRDMFFQARDTLCFRSEFIRVTWPWHLNYRGIIETGWEIGGGQVLSGGDYVLVSGIQDQSHSFPEKMRAHRIRLRTRFSRVYELPYCWIDVIPPAMLKEQYNTCKRILVPHTHADMAVALFAKKKKLIARPQYFQENRELLSRIADEEKLDLRILPSDSWYAINLLILPDDSVVIDKSETETIGILSEFTRVHVTDTAYGGVGLFGGMRCAFNMITLQCG